jgi:hypothetical protein
MTAHHEPSTPRVQPDYHGAGIANLMASVVVARGGAPTGYATLSNLDTTSFKEARNLVLVVIDGLGYRHLAASNAAPTLQRHLRSRLTSVFPSTTAAAIPTFLTGLPPQQHGLTGWHMLFAEIGTVAAVLPFRPRLGRRSLQEAGTTVAALLQLVPLFDRLPEATWAIAPERIVDSEFNTALSGRARRVGYRSPTDLCERVLDAVDTPGRKFVYAYYPELDTIAHVHGIGSETARTELARIDAAFAFLVGALEGSGTTVIVTADHGFVDTTEATRVDLRDHPDLAEMLVLPLCGEPRVAYCYVHPDRCADFERYVECRLAHGFELWRSRDLIEQGWFGIGAAHPRLAQRVGHYTLLARENWAITDQILGEKKHRMVGVHGGTTADEMYVPLILAQA